MIRQNDGFTDEQLISLPLSLILNDFLKDGFNCLNLEEKLILNIFVLQSVRAVLCSTLRRATTVLNVAFRSMRPTHSRCSGNFGYITCFSSLTLSVFFIPVIGMLDTFGLSLYFFLFHLERAAKFCKRQF